MSNKLKKNKKQEESACTAVRKFCGYLLDGMICIYAMLIIVVMPFYNEQGYAYIGTNKAMFFREVSVNGLKFILPLLVVYLVLVAVEKHAGDRRTNRAENAGTWYAKLWDFCKNGLSLTDKFALLYGASLLLSYACSDYKEQETWGSALWGSEGWYMGLLPQLFLLGIYFLISRCRADKKWLFLLFLPVSALVFVLGYLNRFGIYPIDMKIVNPSFLSTIGNINWYCGYLVSVFFGGYYLLWQSGGMRGVVDATGKVSRNGAKQDGKNTYGWRIARIMLAMYVAIGFATLVTQGSLSGLVTLGVMLIVTFCLSVNDSRRMQAFWQETLILSLVCLFSWCLRNVFHREITFEDSFVDLLTNSALPIVATVFSAVFVAAIVYCNAQKKYPEKLFRGLGWLIAGGSVAGLCAVIVLIVVNTLHPGSIGSLSDNSFFTFSPEWGSNRGATWKAGWMCFAEQDFLHKLVGVGPDAMDAFISQDASNEITTLVTERFGTNRLTNAHNEWLTILVNEGIIGFVGFVGMMVSAIGRYIKTGLAPVQNNGAKYAESQIILSKIIAGACGFCLLAYTVNNIFSFQQSMNTATIFIILGIGEAYARAYALCCL